MASFPCRGLRTRLRFGRLLLYSFRTSGRRHPTKSRHARHHVWPGAGKDIYSSSDNIPRHLRVLNSHRCRSFGRIQANRPEYGLSVRTTDEKGRGAAFPANIDNLHDIASAITNIGERISFSVKMRLGTDSPKLWRHTIEILNTVPLSHICVHPRTARQAYSRESVPGRVWRTAGNIDTSDSFQRRHPYSVGHRLHNISISENRGSDGRTRPSGTSFTYSRMARRPEWNRQNRIEHILALHDLIYMHYSASLCGDAQILSKIKSFWDYLEPETGHRASKAIRKASNIKAYHAAIGMIAERR